MSLVVKVGGATGNAVAPVLSDVAGRRDLVLVHGGSEEVDRLGAALGRPSEYYTSPSGVVSRRSDPAHLEIVVLALAGKVRTDLVAGLAREGVTAVGLSGVDGRLLLARRKEGVRAVVDGHVVRLADDLSGTVERVNVELLRWLLSAGIVPVVGPPAVDEKGQVLNVDADRAAARVAAALGAETLVILTNVPGVLRDRSDPASRIPHLARSEIEASGSFAVGRMRKKLLAAGEALDGGVRRVVIAASGRERPIAHALDGEGTVID